MNLKPLGDRVIIKQDEAEETTASGLYLATEAKEKPQTGTVLAVGEGKLDKDCLLYTSLSPSCTLSRLFLPSTSTMRLKTRSTAISASPRAAPCCG